MLHVVDTESTYSEASIVSNWLHKVVTHTVQVIWLLMHDVPRKCSADGELTNEFIRSFIAARSITLAPRSVSRYNKTDIIDGETNTLK